MKLFCAVKQMCDNRRLNDLYGKNVVKFLKSLINLKLK